MIANTIKRKLYGVSIKTKLFGGFSLLLILALIMGGYVVRTLKIFEEISYNLKVDQVNKLEDKLKEQREIIQELRTLSIKKIPQRRKKKKKVN